ncbi:MAG: NPCBM/NEW2 domain-containing protein [Ginsengibacter sp.]
MMTKCFLRCILFLMATIFYNISPINAQDTDTLWLQKIDLTRSVQFWKSSPKSNPLMMGGRKFRNNLASHTEGLLKFEVNGNAQRFQGLVGLADSSNKNCRVVFSAFTDGKEVFKSPVMALGSKVINVDINLEGAKELVLRIEDNGSGLYKDQAGYANAFILYKGPKPVVFNFNYIDKRNILTPPESPYPKIHGAKVFGVRPGHPFQFRISATGKRPMTFAAENLPKGLSLNTATGIITGVLEKRGETVVTLKATNELNMATRKLKIVVGDKIALTPPMGWNGYNRFGDSLSQAIIKAAVDTMVNSGLINHGWTYINIDDGWSVKPGSTDPMRGGEPRDANGMINSNQKYPDMKELTDYIHSKGLKAGLYSSPGKLTCGGYTASYQFEEKDAKRWADWGFDYIKYDYCQYEEISKSHTIEALQKPYIIMRHALDKLDRDIVFSFSQYGMGDSWKWAGKIGGNCWRTTGDLIDTWGSLSETGFTQAGHEKYAGPGHWNDPDMLVVGNVGWGELKYPSRLTADEQYTHISLWSLLAAPLLIGCDIVDMDDFTKSLLTNDEVLDIDQDPLGNQASRIFKENGLEIWAKDLEDGSKAVGLFNRNSTTETIRVKWNILGLNGRQIARDLWRQRNEGIFSDSFSAIVPAHGVKLITLRKAK